MRTLTRFSAVLIAIPAFSASYQQFLSPASPQEVVAARKVDRVAWVDYAEGKRNAYTAAAPAVRAGTADELPERRRHHDVGDPDLGRRQHGRVHARRAGEPRGLVAQSVRRSKRTRARGLGGAHQRRTRRGGWSTPTNPELAPDGSAILFVKGGQIYRAKITPVKPASEVDRGEKAFITEWGVQSDPKWSPDGRKIAFVSTRTDHSFIVVYDVATRSVKYMSPSVDFDTTPMWLADSKHLIFMRRPGLPFGQQAQQGDWRTRWIPNGPAASQTAAPGGRGGGRGGRGGAGQLAACGDQQLSGPDASHVQRRLHDRLL